MSAPYRYQRPAPTPHIIAAPNPMTPGVAARVYLIRLALGDGVKTPMSMERFAILLTFRTGRQYTRGTIARIEVGHQPAQLADIEAMATIDPKQRGACWLAFGDGGER